jgi:hypothetical protein
MRTTPMVKAWNVAMFYSFLVLCLLTVSRPPVGK